MKRSEDEPQLVAEGELALARLALDSGELSHAARHISNALAVAPTLPEAHETLAALATHAGAGVLDLFPVGGEVYVGSAVAHAHLVAEDQPATAFDLLIAATHAAPASPWAAVPWVEADEFPHRFQAEQLAHRFMRLSGAVPEPVDAELRPALEPYLRLVRKSVAAHPGSPLLLGAASAIARRFGCLEEAVAWARRAASREPSMLSEMWLGYAYRAAGRVDDAVAAWRRALRHEPANLALHTDIAEILAGAGRIDEALGWIDRALEYDPTDLCAFPTGCVLRFLRDGDVAHLIALTDHLRANPGNEHAKTMLSRACRGRLWLGGVRGGDDAVSDLLRQVLAGHSLAAGGTARLTALESPSAMLTLERAIPGLTVRVADIPAPDIREPRREDGQRLWTYQGVQAHPAPPPPSPATVAAVCALAHHDWDHPPAAYDAAVVLAGVPLDELVSILAYPPTQRLSAPTPDGPPDPGVWVRTVQVWACLGILHHGTDEQWQLSQRRQVLAGLAFGVEDWVSEAAIFALVTAAWLDPQVRPDVAGLVRDRLLDAIEVSRRRPVSIVWSLARLALLTPGLDAATRRTATLVLHEPAGDEPPTAPSAAPPAAALQVPAQRTPNRMLRRLTGRE